MTAPAALTPRRGHSTRSLLATLATVVVAHGVAVAVFCVALGADPVSFGSASEVLFDGEPTGVYRLSVRTEPRLPGTSAAARVAASDYTGDPTPDQLAAQGNGWTAACTALGRLEVLDPVEVSDCTLEQRPTVGVAAATLGPSAGLAEAIAAVTAHFDVLGDLRVAATGELHSTMWTDHRTGAQTPVTEVLAIGGARHKADAARAAGVDVLIVPVDNAEEFSATVTDGGPEVVGVATVHGAVLELCRRSATADCAALPVWE